MTDHGGAASLEIERKYEVLGDEPLPRIELPTAASVAEIRAQMVARYWDTAERELGRAGLALRSRSGGSDAGWHLKERGPSGVRELHWPAADEIPEGAVNALRERLGTVAPELVPVATVQTDRTVRRLLDAQGRLLIELADDHVLATDHEAGFVRAWREWEAELGEGADLSLLELAEPQLLAAGARPSLSEAKIQRTLGQTVPAAWRRRAPLPELIACALIDLADRIAAAGDAVRADEPDAVHQTRILVRRARDLISLFRRDLGVSAEDAAPARDALQGLGTLLGAVRDAEVRADHAERLLAEVPAVPGLRRVHRLLVGAAQTERAAALAELRERIEPDSHASVDEAGPDGLLPLRLVANRLRALGYLAAQQDPAAGNAGAGEPAAPAEAIAERLDGQLGRLERAAAKRADAFVDLEGAGRLHGVRKRARRIRYAVEELGERSGVPAPVPAPLSAGLAKDAHAVQDLLGEARDLLVLAQHLEALAEPVDGADEPHVATVELAGRLARSVRDDAGATLASGPSVIARLWTHKVGA